MKSKIGFFNSIRTRLFLSLCIIVIVIVLSLIFLNNFVLRQFYEYSKEKKLQNVYESDLTEELDKIAINNNFDILIRNNENVSVYSSNKDYYATLGEMVYSFFKDVNKPYDILKKNENYTISTFKDNKTNINYIMLVANLDNFYKLYIRMPVASIDESVKISNEFLSITAFFIIIIGGIVFSFVSNRFSEPIVELNEIAKKMSNLDFSRKYKQSDDNDEIDMLGNSINTLSDKLQSTIEQLKNNNMELEKDIEEKSKIDEMRKSFISDVSHELKTPIALIQGYSEGLIENVNTDEESRKFYAEVILDESNKMDKLVKQLLELMKLEYEKREFNNQKFDIIELIKEVIRKCHVMIEEHNIKIKFDDTKPIYVNADDFYIDQVITNYFTNAIKHCEEVDKEKTIEIKIKEIDDNKVKIAVFNTGKNIDEEQLERIWVRFYKIDSSRNREDGGSGIGLALVKAIMSNYDNQYGVTNKKNGVEFYIELPKG